jgi:HEAT repeat protein
MHQSVLKRLASIWVASCCGMVDPTNALAELPAELVIDSMEDVERTPFQPDDLGALLQLVSRDPRVQVRARAAELAGSVWRNVPLPVAQEVLLRLSGDPSARVRAAAGRGLAQVIERAAPADRIELISEWSTSTDPDRRVAIARALCAQCPMFVTDLAIEQLASDPNAEVRAAALEAAAAHFVEAPTVYAAIAQSRSLDEDEGVRHAARRLLMRR